MMIPSAPNEEEWVEIRCSEDNTLMLRATPGTSGWVECKCRTCKKIVPILLPYRK